LKDPPLRDRNCGLSPRLRKEDPLPTGTYLSLPQVREAAQRLGTFTIRDLAEELDVHWTAASRRLNELLAEGMVSTAGLRHSGRGRPAALFRFAKPEFRDRVQRRKEPPPEKLVARRFVRSGNLTSGRATRTGSAIVNELIREVAPQGVRVRKRSHRMEYIVDGKVVATSSTTPGASSLKETRSHLRKAGIAA
jgi:DNA-binding Lrp family transcriptional regulator